MLELALGLVLGGVFAWVVFRRLNISYRTRWREAVALIDPEDPATPSLEPKRKRATKVAKANGKGLLDLPSWTRVEIEEDRLQRGLEPRDPLSGLPSWSVAEMHQLRLSHGFDMDENGNWVVPSRDAGS